MTIHVGIAPDKVANLEAEFGLGDVGIDKAGREFMYVKATEAIAVNTAVMMDEVYGAELVDLTATTPGTGQGKPAGVSMVVMALNEFAWVARNGTGTDIKVTVLSDAAAYTDLNATATPGSLDDALGAGVEVIVGIVVITTDGGSGSVIQAVLNYPYVGRSLLA